MDGISSVLYQNQSDKFSKIEQDYNKIKSVIENQKTSHGKGFVSNSAPQNLLGKSLNKDCFEKSKDVRSVLDVIPMFRRTQRVPDKLHTSEYIPAMGLVSLAVLNGPEDMRDIISACKQIKAKLTNKPFEKLYNYKHAQHPFSFFKGTLLHNFFTPDKSPLPKLASRILDHDRTLYDTFLGGIIDKIFKIDTKLIKTPIKHIRYRENFPQYVYARQFNTSSSFGELTARAMLRTTTLGAATLGAIEAVHFANEVYNGKKISTSLKQSAITYIGSIAGIGYIGAIGAKHFGPAGSLIGMGIGSIAGNKIASHFNKY